MKTTKTLVETFSLDVVVTQHDIDNSDCLMTTTCMYAVAAERALRQKEEREAASRKRKYIPKDHKVEVDKGEMRVTFDGHRWPAFMPPKAKRNLHQFDCEKKAKAAAKERGEKFVSAVKPHTVRFKFQKGRKVTKVGPRTGERLAQIRAARAARKEKTGIGDHQRYKRWNERIAGLGNF